ncbi:MAG: peptidase T [Clostridiales bacterium]|nr:peptidase T [Clostridiales bacterium]
MSADNVTGRFLRYIAVDTASDESTGTSPSTMRQFDLAEILIDELRSMGIPGEDIRFDKEHCYIYCRIKASEGIDEATPKIGFIAHMDTSPEAPGKCVSPKIIENYDGSDIILGAGKVLSPENFPDLKLYEGQTLITTDGTTLLGADDKAGVAEIMSMAEYFMAHPEEQHGEIWIAFTPDEEIGEGTKHFDIEVFGADFAYTVDGGRIGEISYENFNAASANITVTGRNVHPGDAYGKMVNSLRIAGIIDSLIPSDERPETTRDHEGFYHLFEMNGACGETVMRYLIRDHDGDKFEEKKARLRSICGKVMADNPGSVIDAVITDTYYNMISRIIPENEAIIDRCIGAMKRVGIEPFTEPIRGGTDGATLSFMGLPCPNICSGGHNYHGVYEFVCRESMERITALLIEIARGKQA